MKQIIATTAPTSVQTTSLVVLLMSAATGCTSVPQPASSLVSITDRYSHASQPSASSTPNVLAAPMDWSNAAAVQPHWWRLFNELMLDGNQARAQHASPNPQAVLTGLQHPSVISG
ncbi:MULTISPECIES: hypothetical protein [Stenotrophomonas]|uniref:hypothetical protein n=1 Tax=Stenotrophomonas TaxID=40323 RepID=UPI000AE1E1D2|nr:MULTISPECIES: hypothetical protein [Stenotrophomonas]